MDKYLLDESAYFWWHGEKINEGMFCPASAVRGQIKITEKGQTVVSLDTLLPLKRSNNISNKIEAQSCMLQGRLQNKNKFILIFIDDKEEEFLNGYMRVNFFSSNCLVGTEFFHGKKILFSSIKIELQGYENWLNFSSLDITQKRKSGKLLIKYQNPKNLVYRLDEGKIIIKHEYDGGGSNSYNFSLNIFGILMYIPLKYLSLEEMKSQFNLFQDLFIILTNSEYSFNWPILSVGRKQKKYTFYFLRNINFFEKPKHYKCSVTFPEIIDQFGGMVSTWKSKMEGYAPAFYSYLGIRRGILLYTENMFLNLITGIESFHRRKHPQSVQSLKLVEKIERILQKVDDTKDKKWLKGRLRHAQEPSLDQRIHQVLENISSRVNKNMLVKFSKDCAHYRNEISHFGIKRDSKDYNTFHEELLKITKVFACLYHALILKEIGLDDKIVERWFQNVDIGRNKRLLNMVGLYEP